MLLLFTDLFFIRLGRFLLLTIRPNLADAALIVMSIGQIEVPRNLRLPWMASKEDRFLFALPLHPECRDGYSRSFGYWLFFLG